MQKSMQPQTRPAPKIAQVLIPVVLIVSVVWGGLAFLRHRDVSQGSPETPPEGFELKVGAKLPTLHLHPWGGGGTVTLTQIPGQIYLINFWATWCEACMVEMPSLVRLRRQLKPKGFEILGINLDELSEGGSRSAVDSAIGKLSIEFPVFSDLDGELAEVFDLGAIPLSVLVSSEGRILWIERGERVWDSPQSLELIEKLMEGGAS